MRRSRLPLLAGSLLALLAAPAALAITPPGTVTVDTDGCSFTVHIDLDQQAAVVGWTINASTEVDWNDGTTVFSGSGPTDADGKLDVGPMTADAGEYNVVVDDETPVDSSSIIEHFALTCESGAGAPAASASAGPGRHRPGVGGTPPRRVRKKASAAPVPSVGSASRLHPRTGLRRRRVARRRAVFRPPFSSSPSLPGCRSAHVGSRPPHPP